MPALLKPVIDDHAPERRVLIGAARKDAHAFRGAFLDKFARLERSLGSVLVLASKMPDYGAYARKSPHLYGQKIALLRKLVDANGPLASLRLEIDALLDNLSQYDELRNFMSHAALEVAVTERDETLYIFRMLRLQKQRAELAELVIPKDRSVKICNSCQRRSKFPPLGRSKDTPVWRCGRLSTGPGLRRGPVAGAAGRGLWASWAVMDLG